MTMASRVSSERVLKSWSGWSMGVPAGVIFYMRLIIYVLMAREKVRLEEGEFQATKKPFM
jgi:hypothetical protein